MSFAGQQDTFLNVDEAGLLDAVVECWSSLWTPRAIGYRNREGNFVQTTTYLVGQKKKTKSTLSFLRVSEFDEESEQELKGLFLRTKRQKGIKAADADRVLKLMADLYSRLGFFTGMFSTATR